MSAIRRPDLSRLHSKATVKCECGLVQFQTGTTCRRCGREFEEREEIELLPAPKVVTKVVTNKQVGTALTLLRISQDLTQRDVAKRVGMYAQHISKLERGERSPGVSTFEYYCGAFGVTPYGLLVIAEAIH